MVLLPAHERSGIGHVTIVIVRGKLGLWDRLSGTGFANRVNIGHSESTNNSVVRGSLDGRMRNTGLPYFFDKIR